jgi:hypothetical protein
VRGIGVDEQAPFFGAVQKSDFLSSITFSKVNIACQHLEFSLGQTDATCPVDMFTFRVHSI